MAFAARPERSCAGLRPGYACDADYGDRRIRAHPGGIIAKLFWCFKGSLLFQEKIRSDLGQHTPRRIAWFKLATVVAGAK
jgi:hypothetical protein